MEYQVVVCGGIAPDPLQTLEPITTPTGPGLKNEMMLPAVFDPWAAHALWESNQIVKANPGSKLWVVSLGPKAKLQQVMMTVAQKLPFEFIPLDGPGNGFTDSAETAKALAAAIEAIPGLDKSRLIVCGGWESATRGAGVTMQRIAERLGIREVFIGVDEVTVDNGALIIKERIEGGAHQVSRCAAPPAVLAWATGSTPEPPNHPQTGMANMRVMMPALQKAKPTPVGTGCEYVAVSLPKQQRETKIVKDKPAAEIARELAAWIQE